MPVIPLALNAYNRADAFVPEVLCVNFYLEEDQSGLSPDKVVRIQRPGLSTYLATPAVVRGIYHELGVLGSAMFGVFGTGLYSFTEDAATLIGEVGGSGKARFAANYEKMIVLSLLTPYSYDGVTLAEVDVPEGSVVDVASINNYLVFACGNGRFYWLEPGSSTIDTLDFATAESAADGVQAVQALGDELFFFGQSTVEPWQLTGNSDAPFLRAGGRTFARGCLSRDTVRLFDNSIVWVGEDGVVYRLGNVPQRISDHSIEERLRKRTSQPHAMVLEHDGHKFYVLTIPGQGSFAYDPAAPAKGVWPEFRWATGAPSTSTTNPEKQQIIGDEARERIYLFDPDTARDDGSIITRQISGSLPLMGRSGRQSSLSVGVGSSGDFTLQVRWKDGQDDYPGAYEELEARAPYDVANLYRLGTPDQPFRSFEIRVDDDVRVRISGAMANEGWR